MKLKEKRNAWCFAGVGYLIAIIAGISQNEDFSWAYILLIITSIISFINAYKTHKKITNQ